MAKFIIISGIMLVIIGLLIAYKDSVPFIRFIGRLPGGIHIERKNFSVHIPIVTSLIFSVILSLIFFFINKFK